MNGNATIADQMKAWIHAPVTQTLDVTQVFLLTGLVIVSAILWGFILRKLKAEV